MADITIVDLARIAGDDLEQASRDLLRAGVAERAGGPGPGTWGAGNLSRAGVAERAGRTRTGNLAGRGTLAGRGWRSGAADPDREPGGAGEP
jgi:hypothetical protein